MYEEVLIFTCGLMSDPHLLIEHVREMLVDWKTHSVRVGADKKDLTNLTTVGKNSLILNLIRSLYVEANMPLESKPHHNQMLNFYSHQQDDVCGRARDNTPIEISSDLYLFMCLRECAPCYNIKQFGKNHKNCVVQMFDITGSVANSLLLTCREISRNQPITDLWIFELYCDTSHSVPADVFHLSKNAQSITIGDSTIPVNLAEHLLSQLHRCEHLNKLHLENIRLYYPATRDIPGDEMSSESCSIQGQGSKLDLKCDSTSQSQSNTHQIYSRKIVSLINKQRSDQSLQYLYHPNYSIPKIECTEMLKCLSKYRHLTQLNLRGNIVGEAGIHIVEMIDSLGLDSQLQLLYLGDCSIPINICGEIIKSLKNCKQLAYLDLGGQILKYHGKHLAELIENLGIDSPLQRLYLENCSIPELMCTEMLKCLSKYRHLTHLNLNGNTVGEAGIYIVEMIDSLGLDSQLESLFLGDCSIPINICRKIIKSLKNCKQLAYFDLGGQHLKYHGKHLAELIENLGTDSPLQQLGLGNCSIPEVVCTEMLKYLSKYRHLTHLNLNGNTVGEAGIYIVEMIDSLGLDSQLESLYLRDCSIPIIVCGEIIKSLKNCKQLTYLDLGGQNLKYQGKHLAELIESLGINSPLQQLYLPNCSIPDVECTEMLKYFSKCRRLTHLNLNGNTVGEAGIYIVEMIDSLGLDSQLESLYLRDCSIPSNICGEIIKSLKNCKQLTYLDLGGQNLKCQGKHLAELIENLGRNSPLNIVSFKLFHTRGRVY